MTKIIKVEKIKDAKWEEGDFEHRIKWPVVKVTTRNWLGKEKSYIAYPTGYGKSYDGITIKYGLYMTELGIRLSDEVSEQISKAILVNKIKQ